jgi:hypothetical protein
MRFRRACRDIFLAQNRKKHGSSAEYVAEISSERTPDSCGGGVERELITKRDSKDGLENPWSSQDLGSIN